MVTFSVPVKQGQTQFCFRFAVQEAGVLFAGSRYGQIPQSTCKALINGLAHQGFSFWVGCANGVDQCFRKALSESDYEDRTFVGCAFHKKVKALSNYGLFASKVVPDNLSPKAALRRRTLYLVKRSCMVILFPETPFDNLSWGKGSRLVFKAALYQLKPLFVVSSIRPEDSPDYRVLSSTIYGVSGYWVVPHPVSDGGFCDDEF